MTSPFGAHAEPAIGSPNRLVAVTAGLANRAFAPLPATRFRVRR
jgi:hypothetical protein